MNSTQQQYIVKGYLGALHKPCYLVSVHFIKVNNESMRDMVNIIRTCEPSKGHVKATIRTLPLLALIYVPMAD